MSYSFRIHLDLTRFNLEQSFAIFDKFIEFIESCKVFFGGGCQNNKICGVISGCEPHPNQKGLCKCGEDVATCTVAMRQKIIDWCLEQKMIVSEVSDLWEDDDYQECKICHKE